MDTFININGTYVAFRSVVAFSVQKTNDTKHTYFVVNASLLTGGRMSFALEFETADAADRFIQKLIRTAATRDGGCIITPDADGNFENNIQPLGFL